MEIIYTHQNADFDAIASMLCVYKLNPAAIPLLPRRLNHNVSEFLALYRSALPFVQMRDFRPETLTHITLTDTQRVSDLPNVNVQVPTTIIDHHEPQRDFEDYETWAGELVGSTTTLMVEQLQRKGIQITSLEATLMMLGIYEDTGRLSYAMTTPRDIQAAAWLLEHNAALDTVRRFLSTPLDDRQQAVFDVLLKNQDTRVMQGYPITICTAELDYYVEGINAVTHRLRDMLDTSALFVLVQMPDTLQFVARSSVDAIDAGQVAELLGGGGHQRASAAHIDTMTKEQVRSLIWSHLELHVQPVTRVEDLMSYGVQTLDANSPLKDILGRIRRIGHEGYPVVDDGRVVGLLTRRDVDRAVEHGLSKFAVREVMMEGHVVLYPSDSIYRFEELMVSSGWGQIPVVEDGKVIGIVTRTDLINHWAQTHPTVAPTYHSIKPEQLSEILGDAVALLIEKIAQHAQEANITLYMVGGVVRDLLLERPNLDIDFVVEGNAIRFAQSLIEKYGGKQHSYSPFGTAKWLLDGAVTGSLDIPADTLPPHIDFATARNEFYEHPTALPTVYSGSIKLDLHRRDFTINTLAIQLSPVNTQWRILDFYGGIRDLNERIIRVLHSVSFIDDPTRILRAVRFAERLNFAIEPRTSELITTALSQLRRITGKRVRAELSLMLREDYPERGFYKLQELGALAAIHPAFTIDEQVMAWFENARRFDEPWASPIEDITDLYWHLLMIFVAPDEVVHVADRLRFSRSAERSFTAASRLAHHHDGLASASPQPSQIVSLLDSVPEMALVAVWLVTDHPHIHANILHYMQQWRHMKSYADGRTLREMGVAPGPHYRTLLQRLRDAWLDGEIATEHGERELLQDLIASEVIDDD